MIRSTFLPGRRGETTLEREHVSSIGPGLVDGLLVLPLSWLHRIIRQ